MTIVDIGTSRAGDPVELDWLPVCEVKALRPDRGLAALVTGRAVAVFRLSATDEVLAVDHVDPATGTPTIARGLVGSSSAGHPIVAAPLHKQRYDLRTGTCLDDDQLSLGVWPVQVRDGLVSVGVARPSLVMSG